MLNRFLLRRQLNTTRAARAIARANRITAIRYLRLVTAPVVEPVTPVSLSWDAIVDGLIADAYQQ